MASAPPPSNASPPPQSPPSAPPPTSTDSTPPPATPPPPKSTPPPPGTTPPPQKSSPPPPVSSPPPPAPAPSPTPVSPPPPPPPAPAPAPASPPPPPKPTPPPPSPHVDPTPPPPPVSSPPPPVSSPSPPVSPSPPEQSPPPPISTPPPEFSPPPPVFASPPPISSPPPPSSPSPTPSPPPPPNSLLLAPPPPYVPPPPAPSSSSVLSVGLITVIAVGSVVGAAVVLVSLVLIFRRQRRRRRQPVIDSFYDSPYPPYPPLPVNYTQHSRSSSSPSQPKSNPVPSPPNPPLSPVPAPAPAMSCNLYKYEELASATNWFAESNVLGQGGFGVVYQGTLSGKEVAIKKLTLGSGQGEREFRAEVEIISRVHHKNLVTLVGYCIHEDQRLLVYEYVPNKTLGFHLHGRGRPTLDWARRWKIAVGSAKGLAYLHEDCDPKIIHRDIKAANILLDFNFEPKVADFGLAKFVPDFVTHVSSRVVGTFGYMAPEYLQTGKATDRSDVFSYGVMLLELITGRKPVIGDADMAQSLVDWARPLLSRTVKEEVYDELVDPQLQSNYDQYDMARLIHCAAAAVRQLAKKRPRMSQIVRYLEGDMSLEDLNAGMIPGNSEAKGSSSHHEVLRRMALGDINSEDYAESDQTSEYEPTSSSSAITDVMEQQRLNRNQQSNEL